MDMNRIFEAVKSEVELIADELKALEAALMAVYESIKKDQGV